MHRKVVEVAEEKIVMVPNILIISEGYPMFDRSSAGLRSYTTAEIMSKKYKVTYFVLRDSLQDEILDDKEIKKYKEALKTLGVEVRNDGLYQLLKIEKYDAVIIKYYYTAQNWIEMIRLLQPEATLFVDSVDVHYHRLFLKAEVSKNNEDLNIAAEVKAKELAVYEKADVVFAVTEEDKKILLKEDPKILVEILPNIHYIPDVSTRMEKGYQYLIFVGIYSHEPNVDAVLYFHRDIWPLIKREIPDIRLRLIGGQPPSEIKALASEHVEVTGYVTNTLPYLLSSTVSIAPLRFGAGMKGKVGEAMAAGLPVVTTSVGAQGMGVIHGENILIADSPKDFANSVIKLLKDESLRTKICLNGREFIKNNYSIDAVAEKIYSVFDNLEKYPVKKMDIFSRTVHKFVLDLKYQFDRHLAWRLKV